MKCKHDFILDDDKDVIFGVNCILNPVICQICNLKAFERYEGYTIVNEKGEEI